MLHSTDGLQRCTYVCTHWAAGAGGQRPRAGSSASLVVLRMDLLQGLSTSCSVVLKVRERERGRVGGRERGRWEGGKLWGRKEGAWGRKEERGVMGGREKKERTNDTKPINC